MLHVAVCDDEREILTELSAYLEEFRIRAKEGIKYRCFRKGKELLEEMAQAAPARVIPMGKAVATPWAIPTTKRTTFPP